MQPQHKEIEGKRELRIMPADIREVSDGAQPEGSRRLEISFSSELPVERWYGPEILCHDVGSANLERLGDTGSLLFHHGKDPNYGSLPIGKIVRAWMDDESKKSKAIIEFDTDEKSDLIFQKAKSGSVKGISVGYSIDALEEVKPNAQSSNGRFTGPCVVATRWTPYEISVEPTPADNSVGIGRSETPERQEREKEREKEGENGGKNKMENGGKNKMGNQTEPAREATAETSGLGGQTAPLIPPADAVEKERSRIGEIIALCRDFDTKEQDFIKNGNSVDQVRQIILDNLRSDNRPVPASRVEVTADEEDKYRSAATSGMLARMGFGENKPAAGYEAFRGMSLHTLAVDCAARSGVKGAHALETEDLMRSVLGLERGAFADSSTFVSIVNDSLHAVIMESYQTASTTYQFWTGEGSNPDFKPTKRFRLSAAGDMKEIPENGEFKYTMGKDEDISTTLSTYGKKFGFSRQTIINDSLGTVARQIQAQVRTNLRFINRKCYELLTANGKIYDKEPLFAERHNNLLTGAPLSVDSLNAMIVAMAKQTDISGKDTLNITPRFLLVPKVMQITADRLIESAADPEAPNSGTYNPMKGRFQVISDISLDTISPTGYYTIADPRDVDTIEVTYLNGKKEPTLESRVSFDTLGIEYRMFHDFGINVIDYRGMAYNPGK